MIYNTETLKKFVVLEGLDGSGTTTQLSLLANKMEKNNIPFFATYEPSESVIGGLIRSVLTKERMIHPESLARLFTADRTEHVFGTNGILEHIHRGEVVISDRYLFSSHAYQSLDCDFELIVDINRYFPLPELLLFIDLEPEICQERMATRRTEELFDDLPIQKKTRELYLRSINGYPQSGMHLEIIDGNLPIESVAEKIWEILENRSII